MSEADEPIRPGSAVRRRSLMVRRDQISADLADTIATLAQLKRLRADGFDDDEQDPDGMPLSTEMTKLASQIRDGSAQLDEIASAIDDLAKGTYGICQTCGGRIADGRLEVRPTATQCVQCARLAG